MSVYILVEVWVKSFFSSWSFWSKLPRSSRCWTSALIEKLFEVAWDQWESKIFISYFTSSFLIQKNINMARTTSYRRGKPKFAGKVRLLTWSNSIVHAFWYTVTYPLLFMLILIWNKLQVTIQEKSMIILSFICFL